MWHYVYPCFTVSLSIADMMVGIVVVPFSVYTEMSIMVTSTPVWYHGGPTFLADDLSSHWQPCMLIGPVFAGCTFVSISTIFLMTLERSVAILWPLHKDTLVTRRRTLLLIFASWICSFGLALAPLILSRKFTLMYNECSRMCIYVPIVVNRQVADDSSILLLFPAFDFILLFGTLAVNILSFTSICQNSRRRKLLSEGGERLETGASCSHRPSFSDIKAAKTIGILTFAFTASFSPIAVFVLGNIIGYTWCNFSFFAFWILAANSCCNVIIYSMMDHRFRKGVSVLFHKDYSPPHSEKSWHEPAEDRAVLPLYFWTQSHTYQWALFKKIDQSQKCAFYSNLHRCAFRIIIVIFRIFSNFIKYIK